MDEERYEIAGRKSFTSLIVAFWDEEDDDVEQKNLRYFWSTWIWVSTWWMEASKDFSVLALTLGIRILSRSNSRRSRVWGDKSTTDHRTNFKQAVRVSWATRIDHRGIKGLHSHWYRQSDGTETWNCRPKRTFTFMTWKAWWIQKVRSRALTCLWTGYRLVVVAYFMPRR